VIRARRIVRPIELVCTIDEMQPHASTIALASRSVLHGSPKLVSDHPAKGGLLCYKVGRGFAP